MSTEIIQAQNNKPQSFQEVWHNPESVLKLSAYLAKSGDMIPARFQNRPEAVFAAAMYALGLGVNPMMFMQDAYVVQGKVGLPAKTAIACANASRVFVGPITFAFSGEPLTPGWTCTATATVRETQKEVAYSLAWNVVEAEGWLAKNPKWRNMSEHMMQYRTATFLIRLFCPEVLMGLSTREELEDTTPIQATVEAMPINAGDLLSKLTAANDAYRDALPVEVEEEK